MKEIAGESFVMASQLCISFALRMLFVIFPEKFMMHAANFSDLAQIFIM